MAKKFTTDCVALFKNVQAIKVRTRKNRHIPCHNALPKKKLQAGPDALDVSDMHPFRALLELQQNTLFAFTQFATLVNTQAKHFLEGSMWNLALVIVYQPSNLTLFVLQVYFYQFVQVRG